MPHLPLRLGAAPRGNGSPLLPLDVRARAGVPIVGLLALAMGGCATQQADSTLESCNPHSVACDPGQNAAGGEVQGGAGNSGGSTSSDTAAGGLGSSTSGASSSAGSSGATDPGSAGTTGFAGGAGISTTGGSAGTGATTAGAGGAAAGAGGTPGSGGSLGSAGAAGSAGTVGTAGAGGAANALCTTAIPARTSWVATASEFSNACTVPTDALCNPPAYAIDADPTTRFSTGTKQLGTEWLQIDLGASGTVDQVTLSVSNGDYGRHIQIRMSNTANDTAAPVLVEQDGMTGLQAFKFAPKTARYVLISQTGMLMTGEISWWSVQDATVTCN